MRVRKKWWLSTIAGRADSDLQGVVGAVAHAAANARPFVPTIAGDVLAGIIGRLLAAGLPALRAAAAVAWIHAESGRLGPRDGLLAGDPTFEASLDAERAELEDELSDYKAWPVVSLGFVFNFL